MTVDYIRYDILTQDAMRSVVRTVLADAAAKGLPGEHHFFISFDTRAEGVNLSPRIKAQYPKEMTIVLQHQFWDLVVGEDRFEVGLSFSGVAERLTIPFRAITGFADPSVQFGLQFAANVEEDQADEESVAEQPAEKKSARPPARRERAPAPKQSLPTPANPATDAKPAAKSPTPPAAKSATSATAQPTETPSTGGEVVRLDRFRKK
ncbi:MAG TPA: ClpXP protease specificity-enhancing factor SspB [Xanthobacteraceae bacterium]|nr:ClpXP protease specificity-enhancing factor SspB [Xanthobacteraceae bacterium]